MPTNPAPLTINPAETTAPAADVVVRLNLSVSQAQATAVALDLFTRLSLGQFEEISGKFVLGEFMVSTHLHNAGRLPTEEECVELRSLCAGLKRVAGHMHGGSFGLGAPGVSQQALSSYEVMKVLKQRLALHRDPAPSFRDVDYDGLTVRYTQDVAPRCDIARAT